MKTRMLVLSVLVLVAMLLFACAPAAPAAEAPAEEAPAEEAPAEESPAEEVPAEEAPAESMEPTELGVAAMFCCGLENDWDGTMYESFQRIQAASPHGLEIHDLAFTDGLFGEEAEQVMKEYADSGEYDIIWLHSNYNDQLLNLKDSYPDIMWVMVGAGFEPHRGNAYLIDKRVFEATYLQGVIAGMMTESNVIGAVGPFPFDSVNADINGFFDGARSVNPDIEITATFIESWFDPPKSNEAAAAQIAAGVDQMFMRADAFDTCESSGILCYGPIADNTPAAPNSVVTDALAFWDPEISWIIDQWYEHKSAGTPFDGNPEYYYVGLADGGSDLSAYNENVVDQLPQEVLDAVEEVRAKIIDGTLEIEYRTEPPVSD
jgi:basic membrane protein A and related proteins